MHPSYRQAAADADDVLSKVTSGSESERRPSSEAIRLFSPSHLSLLQTHHLHPRRRCQVDTSTADWPIRWGARGVDDASIILDEGVDWDGCCCSCVKVAAGDHGTHSGIKSGPAGTMMTGDAGVSSENTCMIAR